MWLDSGLGSVQRNLVMQTSGSCISKDICKVFGNILISSSVNVSSEIRPLQDLTNARTPSLIPCLEEVPERPSRRRPDPTCYREPSLKWWGFKLLSPWFLLCCNSCSALTCCPGLNTLMFCWSFSPSYPRCFCEFLFTTVWLSINDALAYMCVGFCQQAIKNIISFTEQIHLLASLHMWYPCANKRLLEG